MNGRLLRALDLTALLTAQHLDFEVRAVAERFGDALGYDGQQRPLDSVSSTG